MARIAFAGLMVVAAVALAQPAATAPADEVGTLIKHLGADDWHTRNSAQKRLVQMGEVVMPRLQQLVAVATDGETRTRAQEALDQIVDAAVLGPTLVTLDLKDVPGKDAIAEIAKQGRCSIQFSPSGFGEGLPKVTVKADREPFWAVLKRVCAELKVQPDTVGAFVNGRAMALRVGGAVQVEKKGLTLVASDGGWERTPTFVSGPFIVSVERIMHTGMIVPAQGAAATENVSISCSIMGEPKMRIASAGGLVKIIEPAQAQIANGAAANLLTFRGVGRTMSMPSDGSWMISISVVPPANPGGGMARNLERLKGTAFAKVLVKSDDHEIANALRTRKQSWNVGDKVYVVKSVMASGTDAVEVVVSIEGLELNDGGEIQTLTKGLALLDDQKRPLSLRQSGIQITGGAYEMKMTFNAAGHDISQPVNLRWSVPRETKDVEIPFEFTNLPLP